MEFRSYESMDEMFLALRSAMKSADSRVMPWQQTIKAGDYFVKDSQLGFPVYGQILAEEGRRPKDLRHYRLCKAHSLACPEGEMGDVHVSTIDALISQEEFDEARERRWWEA